MKPLWMAFLGSGPNRGQSPVEWEDFPYVRPSVRPSICPSVHPSVRMSIRPSLWAIQPGLKPSQLGLRPSQPGLRPNQPSLWMDGQTDVHRENLPILQDFVPYRGRCPASPYVNQENVISK